jgi:hypothetical protein
MNVVMHSESYDVRQTRKSETADAYFRLTGKKAEIQNLYESLALKDLQGKALFEIAYALDVIAFMDIDKKDDKLTQLVISCYRQSEYSIIRVKCIAALGRLKEEKADQFAHEILEDPKVELETKLRIAGIILERGRLFGYPFLQEGLTSDNKYTHDNIALPLMNQFEKYDGREYEKGKKINMKAMQSLQPLQSPK